MNTFKMTLTIFSLLLIFIGCDEGNPSGSHGDDIEIAGTWSGKDSNSGEEVDVTVTINNSKIDWDYGGSSLSANIVDYDNNLNRLILQWTNHPAFNDKYQKFLWGQEGANTLTLAAYSEEDTKASAENSTTTSYTPVNLSKN